MIEPNADAVRPLPPRPELVLRVAFAGARELPVEKPSQRELETAVGFVYETLSDVLHGLVARGSTESRSVVHFYAPQPPLIRVVTGLAEGGDAMASRLLLAMPKKRANTRWELAGVLPFSRDLYRGSRAESFRGEFDTLYKACAYVVELDGVFDPNDALPRHRAYRAQAAVMLRHADVLIAMTDGANDKPGGTKETIRAALRFGLTVIVIDAGAQPSDMIRIIQPGEDADEVLSRRLPAPKRTAIAQSLAGSLARLLADPDVTEDSRDVTEDSTSAAARAENAVKFLREFFDADAMPPLTRHGKAKPSFRKDLWKRFEARFTDRPAIQFPAAPALGGYGAFRDRATNLNRHYGGLYRGAFLVSFQLAVIAVAIAALSLMLRLYAESAGLVHAVWWSVILGVLGCVELATVIAILINTRQSNGNLWNDRAVDYRYLAERLRATHYLPALASFQPPPFGQGYGPRAARQSAADWLAGAIMRHVSPRTVATPASDRDMPPVITPNPGGALQLVRERWLPEQRDYHHRNAKKMERMFRSLENVARRWTITVIAAVSIEVVIGVGALLHLMPEELHLVTPAMLFLAALLPAAVSAANGIRVQAECERLSERSGVMIQTIDGRLGQAEALSATLAGASKSASNPGSWLPSVLELTEAVTTDMANEAAEWSVLYAKVIPEV